jgi:hypothetical protein
LDSTKLIHASVVDTLRPIGYIVPGVKQSLMLGLTFTVSTWPQPFQLDLQDHKMEPTHLITPPNCRASFTSNSRALTGVEVGPHDSRRAMIFGLGTNVLDSEPGAPVASFLTGATVKLVGTFPYYAAISSSGNLDVIGLAGAFCHGDC